MLNNLFFIFFAGVAVSYAWGMRGTIIGGEKGAMLPGAFLGFIISVFSGSCTLAENPWLIAGVGALAMYCGGNMTYGETLGLSMDSKPPTNMKKGLIALFVKGGVWFGLFGGYVSLFITVTAGKMTLLQIILFFTLLPVFAVIFYLLLNKPYNPDDNKFPRIYFSVTRHETWGGLMGMWIEILVFSAVLKDWSSLVTASGTFLIGGVSWVLAQIFQIYTKYPNKKGKHTFGKANENGFIDSWKVMECSLGAYAGMGIAVLFILTKDLFAEKLKIIDTYGFQTVISENVSYALLIIYGIILIADTLQYFIAPAVNRKYNRKLLKLKLITKEQYEANIYDGAEDNEHFRRYKMLCEKAEFAVYSILPMLFCFIGSYTVAAAVTFPVIMLVLCQEVAEKCFNDTRGNITWKLIFFLPEFLLFGLIAIKGEAINIRMTVLMYTFFYETVFFILKLLKSGKITISKSERTVHGFFILCCLAINILTLII